MATYAPGTGGAQAPDLGPVVNSSTSSTTGPLRKKKNRRRVNGEVQYRWPNGTWHSRPFGKSHRSNAGGGSTTSPGTGGTQAPNKPKAKHPLLDRARNIGNMQYAGAERSIAERGLAIPAFYQNYINTVTGAQDQAKQYAAPIEAAAQQRATEAGQITPGLDPNTPAGHDAALAAAARQALGNAFVSTLQTVGAVNNNYLAGRKAVAATSQLGAQQELGKEKTALKKEKGQFIQEKRAELQDKARQQKLENAAFGLKTSESKSQLNKYGYTTQEWNSFSDQKRNRIRNRSSSSSGPDLGKVNQYGITERKWRNMSQAERQKVINDFKKNGGKPKNGTQQFTPTQRHKTKADIRKGMAAIRSGTTSLTYKPEGFWKRGLSYLINDKGYDPLLARAIIQRMRTGRLNPALAKRLKQNYGITLGSGKAFKLPPSAGQVPGVGGIIDVGLHNQPSG